MDDAVRHLLSEIPLFRKLAEADREHLVRLASVRRFPRGETIFRQGDEPHAFLTVARGRVKVSKATPAGKDIILELFGPGDPLGTVAMYEERPYPATAVALEDTTCVSISRNAFYELLEQRPSLVRGLLLAMTRRLVELTRRLTDVTAVSVETRFARLFLKLAKDLGRGGVEGVFIPLGLTRQELADFTGTTVETSIRIMSRWGKSGVVTTEAGGFRVRDAAALARLAEG